MMDVSIVSDLRKKGMTYGEITEELQQANPHKKGCSERSVRRFCKENGISKMSDKKWMKLLKKL